MDLEVAKRALETGITFVANCGLQVLELRRGYVKCLVPFDRNGNHVGTMYAGALFTVAEIPGGALFLSSFDTRRYFPIVAALDMKFLKPAKTDVTIEITLSDDQIAAITKEADANGKATFTLDGEIKDANGVVVATSHGIYQLRNVDRRPA